jgi:hypothetical protein
VTAVPAPYLTYVNFRKEPSPRGRGGRMGKVTRLFYSPFDGAKPVYYGSVSDARKTLFGVRARTPMVAAAAVQCADRVMGSLLSFSVTGIPWES